MGQDGKVQNPTMLFRLMGVDVARFRAHYGQDTIMGEEVSQMIRNLHNSREYDLPRSKIFLFPTPRPNELLCNCTRIIGRATAASSIQYWSRILPRPRSWAASRCANTPISSRIAWSAVRDPLSTIPASRSACARPGRSRASPCCAMKTSSPGPKRKDAIARSAWPIELHSGEKPQLKWLLDDYYDISYDSFVPVSGEGFLVAGRCLSAEHEAMASARVTAQCFSYGQAIGMAAAMSLRDGTPPRQLPVSDLRDALRKNGAVI